MAHAGSLAAVDRLGGLGPEGRAAVCADFAALDYGQRFVRSTSSILRLAESPARGTSVEYKHHDCAIAAVSEVAPFKL